MYFVQGLLRYAIAALQGRTTVEILGYDSSSGSMDFMNYNLIELLNNYVQRATFNKYLCQFIWRMKTPRNPSEFVS
jgi:hypothetical protein